MAEYHEEPKIHPSFALTKPHLKHRPDLPCTMPPTTVDELIQPFLSEPWCMKLIRDPTYTIQTPMSRTGEPKVNHELFARTMKSPDCIPGFIDLKKKTPNPDGVVEERISLFAIDHGIDGYRGVVHGGMVAAMIDESVGGAVKATFNEGTEGKPLRRQKLMTKFLNVTFIRPVSTPGFVQCRVKLDRSEGRKVFYTAVLQDGEGKDLAKGEALFVRVQEKL
ncbi:hypothetical protein M0657_008408 [Pyricularia oryzae]|nr:hypothetical protein M9X92_009663 [Pyricularia oryzae]KAI7916745.1 hypothetical protein M0657_008408 [Pyricularia oryzae]